MPVVARALFCRSCLARVRGDELVARRAVKRCAGNLLAFHTSSLERFVARLLLICVSVGPAVRVFVVLRSPSGNVS